MMYFPISRVPDSLREYLLQCSSENAREFERLQAQHAEAYRNRDYTRLNQLWSAMARHIEPADPIARIEGGIGGAVWIDETRLPPGLLV
jgi:hypothetical protein